MKKTSVTTPTTIKRIWHVVDIENQVLGRQATKIAQLLMGKAKPYYTPQLDCGDYVVVINAAKVIVTGNKAQGKVYRHHTGRPGGFREINFSDLMAKDPTRAIHLAVKGMLPKNKLRAIRLRRFKIFAQSTHPYLDKLPGESK